ncbi:hypothetical protein [Streptomyces sp. LN590]|uniref:hypothetical protein n=1 Tax=unclassified Streptomyces TaxID=2593676 RepID=UPI003716C6C9
MSGYLRRSARLDACFDDVGFLAADFLAGAVFFAGAFVLDADFLAVRGFSLRAGAAFLCATPSPGALLGLADCRELPWRFGRASGSSSSASSSSASSSSGSSSSGSSSSASSSSASLAEPGCAIADDVGKRTHAPVRNGSHCLTARVENFPLQLILQSSELGHLPEPAHPFGCKLSRFKAESSACQISRNGQRQPALLRPAQHIAAHYRGR